MAFPLDCVDCPLKAERIRLRRRLPDCELCAVGEKEFPFSTWAQVNREILAHFLKEEVRK